MSRYLQAQISKMLFKYGVLKDGLQLLLDASNIASYPGNGTIWYDLSGNTRNATLINGVTYSNESVKSLIFNGVNNQVANVGNFLNYPNFTIQIWLKASATQKALADIFDNNHTGSQNFVAQGGTENSNIYGFTIFKINSVTSNRNFSLVANTWCHLTFTYNNSFVTVYKNGVSLGSGSVATPLNYSSQYLRIANWTGENRGWTGLMSMFLVYNKVLSQKEILQNFNSTKSKYEL